MPDAAWSTTKRLETVWQNKETEQDQPFQRSTAPNWETSALLPVQLVCVAGSASPSATAQPQCQAENNAAVNTGTSKILLLLSSVSRTVCYFFAVISFGNRSLFLPVPGWVLATFLPLPSPTITSTSLTISF